MHSTPAAAEPFLVIEGPEQSRVDTTLPDAGLPPEPAVQNIGIFRATRDATHLSDKYGWTYHHHVDMACWRGRLYVGWNSCEKDEDVWPSRELYTTSENGFDWTEPKELFPQGVSTCLRMYFYHASNGRMLAFAGLRTDTEETSEEMKGGIVVREILPDHTLGEMFVLQSPRAYVAKLPPFEKSTDPDFVEAGRQLLGDTVFLEQQDLGRLLGPRRMKWHDASAWPSGSVPGDDNKWVCGKAFSFLDRPDGTVVGVSKMGWTTISTDEGRTWAQPHVPPTLVTGKAKVWAQRTRDGRYMLAYNPSRRTRYPLAIVRGDDGKTFDGMRIVHGELPIQRYEGRFRSIGPQYTRGISHWADDGSRSDDATWLVYSMSKEDLWVSRIPLRPSSESPSPIRNELSDTPAGRIVPGWNTYAPMWSKVDVLKNPDGAGNCLRLQDTDPYDYARVQRVFVRTSRVDVSFQVFIDDSANEDASFEIELLSEFKSLRPVRVVLRRGSIVLEGSSPTETIPYVDKKWITFELSAAVETSTFDLTVDGQAVAHSVPFAEPAPDLHRLSFRTGSSRGVGGRRPVPPGSDVPTAPRTYYVRGVSVTPR